MQDRYAGDIGDFGKFALLKELKRQKLSVGVNWYKTDPPKSEKNSDGSFKQNHGKYKCIPCEIREYDKGLAGKLSQISENDETRCIEALEAAHLLIGNAYYHNTISVDKRSEWHSDALSFFKVKNVDLVFLDPDNGLLVDSVKEYYPRSVKYVFYSEVMDYLSHGQSVLIYNHRSRKAEWKYFQDIEARIRKEAVEYCPKLASELTISAITFPRYSIRDYIAISAKQEHIEKIQKAFSSLLDSKYADPEIRFCYKSLTSDITFSEYQRRLNSKAGFQKSFQALPKEVAMRMIDRENAGTTVKVCMASVWTSKESNTM